MTEVLSYSVVPSYTLQFGCQQCSQPFNQPPEQADAEVFVCPHCGKEYPAGEDSIHDQEKRILEYVHSVARQYKIAEVISRFEVAPITTPFPDRPAYIHFSNEMQSDSHIIFADLKLAFLNSSDFIDTAARLIRSRRHIHDASSGLVISPGEQVDVDDLFRVLGRLQDGAVRSAQQKRYKDKARANGHLINGNPSHGFQIVRDNRGRAHKVPDERERQLMSDLIRWREEDNSWPEIEKLARHYRYKNRRTGKPYLSRTIRRLHELALTAPFPLSEG